MPFLILATFHKKMQGKKFIGGKATTLHFLGRKAGQQIFLGRKSIPIRRRKA